MALLPIRQQTFLTPRGAVTIGAGAREQDRAQRRELPGDTAPARIMPVRIPPAIRRKMAKPLHGADGPYPISWGPPVKYVEIPHGEAGTIATLKIMKGLVLGKWGHRNPEIVMLSHKIIKGTSEGPEKNYRAMAEAILAFMKANVPYHLDPAGLEYIQTPHFTALVTDTGGDCDDHAALCCALAMALGFKAAFRTVKGDASREDQWSHVYAVIGIPDMGKITWLTADSTQSNSFLGWDPPEGKLYGMRTWVIDPSISEEQWH